MKLLEKIKKNHLCFENDLTNFYSKLKFSINNKRKSIKNN